MGKEWKTLDTDFIIFAPCAYSPNTIDADNAPEKVRLMNNYDFKKWTNNYITIKI
jgi:hypothetical protein